MKYLFYLIHPAKFHFFRIVINKLKAEGHSVEIIIITKDIMEDLVSSERWEYTNIFPSGRKSKIYHIYFAAIYNSIRTIFRLLKYTRNKKYDLFITDDFLSLVGKVKNTPTIFITDNDLSTVPESYLLLCFSTYILAPDVTNQKKMEYKKIGYYGYKSLAHLHPNHFTPDRQKLLSQIRQCTDYFFIRCVSVTSTHDVGKKGIGDYLLIKLVDYLSQYGQVIINSERVLQAELEQYRIVFNDDSIAHYIAFAKIFISDSTTMCAEAAVLGVPAIEINDWHSDFRQYKDFNGKYGLIWGFKPNDEENIFIKINEMINNKNLKEEYELKRNKLLDDTIDVSSFIYWLLSEYPSSVEKYFQDKNIQLRFK